MSSDLTMDTSEFNVIFVHSAVDDYPLTPEEFRVYGHIARRAGQGEAWPSLETISRKCFIHKDTARAVLRNLVTFRLLAVTKRGHEGKTDLYRVTKVSAWMPVTEALKIREEQEAAGKAKRAAKKAAKAQAEEGGDPETDPPRNEGRGMKRREGYETKGGLPPETKGGEGYETKGPEVNPLNLSLEGNPEVGEPPLEVEPTASGRDDFGQGEEQEPHAADLPAPAAPVVEQQAPTPVTVEDWISGGEGVEDQASDTEEVPGARDEIHELMWDPQVVNARIDQLFNRRWLKGYQIRGQGPVQPALITEVDGSGVDRATLASTISPEKLEELVAEVRRERARLEAAARNDSSVRVLTAQHMLIQAMQSWALRLENLRASMSTLRAATEADEDARPWDDDLHTPITPTLSLQTPKAGRAWLVGDVVSYRRDRYTITSITDRKITLDSEVNGSVDIIRATSELDALRLVQAAGETIEGCA